MKRTYLTLLTCVLAFACTNAQLNAQEQETAAKVLEAAATELKAQATEAEAQLEDALESSSDVSVEPVEVDVEKVDVEEAVEGAIVEKEDQAVAADDEMVKAIDAEANEVLEGEDEAEEDEEEELEEGPVFVRDDEDGQLIGLATATVGGEEVPIEANVSLVRNGVLISRIVAQEDGSFAFPNVAPGQYDMYGVASSYCGQQAFTVLPESDCTICRDTCPLELSQGGSCYRNFGGAPAASFTNVGTVSNFGGGGFFGGGGGFAGGGGGGFIGGGAVGGNGLRLLGIGGIATAIAVGVSDGGTEASPSE